VAKNAISQEVVAIERRGGAKFEDVQHLVAGVRGREALGTGETDAGIWSAGMIQGLIHDVPTVKELIDRIMSEAETLIKARLSGMLA
jgi:nitronate monooxygenase